MSPALTILLILNILTKKNQTGPVRCQRCYRSTGINRHGYYERYLFNSNEKVKVQRYRCLNPDCDCVTFSILPHPFLRYIRLPLCVLFMLLGAYEAKTSNLSSLAREWGLSRPVVKRMLVLSRRLRDWLANLGLWPGNSLPCLDPKGRWTDFNRVLSWAFYPARYAFSGSHTT